MGMNLPQDFSVVQLAAPQIGTAAAVTSDVLSLKHAIKAWIIVDLAPAGGAALALTPQRCVDVTPSANAVLVTAVPIWANQDTATDDALEPQTDAVNFTTDADVNNKQIVFEIDPASLGETALGVRYDCIRIVTGALPITDYISIMAIVQHAYAECEPPSVIVD